MEGEGEMKKYLLKRILLIIPTLLGITFITYLMIRLAPGDYTKLKLGMEGALKTGSISKEIL
jgi:peptide/nickel transport system permease protein